MNKNEIFKPNTTEYHIWKYHHDGKSVTEIAEIMKVDYEHVKETIFYGWRMQG